MIIILRLEIVETISNRTVLWIGVRNYFKTPADFAAST